MQNVVLFLGRRHETIIPTKMMFLARFAKSGTIQLEVLILPNGIDHALSIDIAGVPLMKSPVTMAYKSPVLLLFEFSVMIQQGLQVILLGSQCPAHIRSLNGMLQGMPFHAQDIEHLLCFLLGLSA